MSGDRRTPPRERLFVEDFDYDLPPDRIAQRPANPRDAARLLCVPRSGTLPPADSTVRELPELLREGDLLVVNDTKVIAARLEGRKASGGRVEWLLLEPLDGETQTARRWRALQRASRAPSPGSVVALSGGGSVRLLDGPDRNGAVSLEFAEAGIEATVRSGLPPLPPYIRREPGDPLTGLDRERYQTVFASRLGAVAAPTAGLHFTDELLERLGRAGVRVARVTLHVGEGTFLPLRVERLDEIRLHEERFQLPDETEREIAKARHAGGRVVAVGTTVVRTLESRPERTPGVPRAGRGRTSLFIGPGFRFRFVDAMLTNFHLPRSSLLMLVSAFAGRERVLEAYHRAIASGYRFYSYGDAMLIADR